MKRIFALLLVVVMAVMALASCAPAEDGIALTKQYYENSAPKKIVAVSTEQFGAHLLDMTTTITNGYLGNLNAATKTVVGKRMRSITEGSGENVEAYIEDVNTTDWFVEGYGTSSDKGATWNADGVSFVPSPALSLSTLTRLFLRTLSMRTTFLPSRLLRLTLLPYLQMTSLISAATLSVRSLMTARLLPAYLFPGPFPLRRTLPARISRFLS